MSEVAKPKQRYRHLRRLDPVDRLGVKISSLSNLCLGEACGLPGRREASSKDLEELNLIWTTVHAYSVAVAVPNRNDPACLILQS